MADAVAAAIGATSSGTAIYVATVPIGDMTMRIIGETAPMVLIIVPESLPAVDRAMILAAVSPLAVARAPMRIGALEVGEGAVMSDVVAAARFLIDAGSVTGQLLRIAPRAGR